MLTTLAGQFPIVHDKDFRFREENLCSLNTPTNDIHLTIAVMKTKLRGMEYMSTVMTVELSNDYILTLPSHTKKISHT
ncbi:MAG: hypothetical protein AB7V56_02940 [Candidatus Nitrosocosmicus sp.]|nr:hypothetical protein [Candidatus Nitrosocosmicus sp.]